MIALIKKITLKNLVKRLGYVCYLLAAILILLEISYRYYVVDFYHGELKGLNPASILEKRETGEAVLAMGDSFTANPESYVKTLRQAFSSHRIVNSAVPGTSIRQSALMAPYRIDTFQPKVFIYQIYVGNDLMEFHHPTASREISTARRSYWWLADRIQVLGFLNYRLRHLSKWIYQDLEQSFNPQQEDVFSPQKYSARTKMHFRAEPYWIENAVHLKQGRDQDALNYIKSLKNMLSGLPSDCKVVLLVIPHCMQVSPLYQERMMSIGAKVENPGKLGQTDYPFLELLQESITREKTFIVNALPVFKKANTEKVLYYENDPHLNAHGQEVLGKYMVEFFKEEAIFEESSNKE